jgi:beta-ureidopropionase
MNLVRIASLDCGGAGPDAAIAQAAGMVEEACRQRTDIVVMPELFAYAGLTAPEKLAAAESIGGKVSSAWAAMAAESKVNILAPLLERVGDKVYNTMVWFDRSGKHLGTYRKAFPTDYEMRDGITPGPLDFDVFHTEAGPIGCCICFDLNFEPVIQRLAAQGAKLVFFPAMFQGLPLLQAWAKLYRMYFVSAVGMASAAVDALGQVMVAPWFHDRILRVEINLDYLVLHNDYNRQKYPEVLRQWGDAVEITPIYMESCAILASRHPEASAAQIAADCGLELEAEYYARSAALRERVLAGGSCRTA